ITSAVVSRPGQRHQSPAANVSAADVVSVDSGWLHRKESEMAVTTRTTLGVVGLGHMGGNMAARLLGAGYRVYGEARRRHGAEHLVEEGLYWRDTPREVAEAAEFVFTSLPDDRVLEAVAGGADGILAGLSAGKVWV